MQINSADPDKYARECTDVGEEHDTIRCEDAIAKKVRLAES
ncbi:MAG: hypothetical protein ACUVRS_03215 [Armatimonadota bacterium]